MCSAFPLTDETCFVCYCWLPRQHKASLLLFRVGKKKEERTPVLLHCAAIIRSHLDPWLIAALWIILAESFLQSWKEKTFDTNLRQGQATTFWTHAVFWSIGLVKWELEHRIQQCKFHPNLFAFSYTTLRLVCYRRFSSSLRFIQTPISW